MALYPQKAEEAYKIHTTVINLKAEITRNFLHLGALLYEMKEKKMFQRLDYMSFAQYLASPEISLSVSSAYSMMEIYRRFRLEYQIPEEKLLPIGRTKLDRILPVVNNDNRDEWLSKAETLSTQDLDKELQEAKGKPVFEYKYKRHVAMTFKGDTHMEILLKKKMSLSEWYCSNCDQYFWTPSTQKAKICPYCQKEPGVNGTIQHEQLGKQDEGRG